MLRNGSVASRKGVAVELKRKDEVGE